MSYTNTTPWVGAQRVLPTFPPFPPSVFLYLLPNLPLRLPRFGFHPAATLYDQAKGTLCPFCLRLLHLGKRTLHPCILQNEAPTRQIYLSLANIYYPERLNFDAWLCSKTFFPLGKGTGRNKASEQHRESCLFTLFSEEEKKNLREQPRLCFCITHCLLWQSSVFVVRKIGPALVGGWHKYKSLLSQLTPNDNLMVSIRFAQVM